MTPPSYRLRDLRVERGGIEVLAIDSLEIEASAMTAIVGPNGAGKTTLLRTLAFLQPPTSGTIEFEGGAVSRRGWGSLRVRQRVTLVFQSPLLFHRSVRANVAYGLRRRGLDGNDRIEAALHAVGLSGFADRPAWKLSGGEAQRVAIARALAIAPPVYLLDEPTASVDRGHVHVVESVMRRLRQEGKTVVFSTHNLEQAYRLADTVVSLVAGRLTAAPPVNLLRGETRELAGARYFFSDPLRIEIESGAAPTVIALDPEDVLVSLHPIDSSARNCFPGQLLKAERDEHGIILTVDCGRPLIARITRHSYEELGLNVGRRVYLTFKSTAIHILDEG